MEMEAVFLKLLNMSIAASWLILAVFILRLLPKKVPRTIYCLLWALVGIRLVLPFSVESSLSLIPSGETVSPDILYAQAPAIHTGFAVLNQAVNPVLASSLAPEPGASVNPLQIFTAAASIIWLLGVAALLLYGAFSYMRLRRRVGSAIHLRDSLWQSETVATPFILGIFRPRIYLPFDLDEQQLEYVVAHEQAHLKRRDHWWKPLGFLLLAVYWFNPLIWLAYGLLCRDIELACDERVVKTLAASEKKAYSAALLACSLPRRLILACPLAFGEVGVKDRIKAVLNYKKPAFWVIVAAAVVCAVVAVCFLTNPASPGRQPASPAAGSYVSRSCLYSNPLSSFLPDDDNGLRYLIGSNRFTIVERQTGETVFDEPVASLEWQALSAADRAKLFVEPLFSQELIADISDPWMIKLSDKYYLFDMDDALWIGDYHSEDLGFWSIFELMPENAAGVSWPFTPAISSRYPAFKFLFDLEYTRIDAECDNGELIGFDDHDGSGHPQGQALSFPAGSALYWAPFASDSDQIYVQGAQIRFTVYNGEQVVCSGTIEVTSTDGTGGIQAIYSAVLTEGDGLMMLEAAYADGAVIQKTAKFPTSETSSVWPSDTTITLADLDHDGADEMVTVSRESADGDLYTLKVLKNGVSEIWREELSAAHVGWSALFLCTLDGEDFLLRYNPANFQGECNYSYDLFSIENGQEMVRQRRSASFDVNGENLLDVDSMTDLAEEVNALLGYSDVLVSTLDGTVLTGPFSAYPFFREDYDILLTGDVETLEEAAAVRAAQIYLRQEDDTMKTITNFDTPAVDAVDADAVDRIFRFDPSYDAEEPLYQVTFTTIDDKILGPIVLFVDSHGAVFGGLLRD